MKTTHKSPQTQSSNWMLISTLLVGLLFTSLISNAQAIAEKVSFSTEEINNTFDINEFSAVEGASKVFFRFLIREDRDEANYILETSINGFDYSPVQLKEGFLSPQGQSLLYCFTVDLTKTENQIYRVKMSTPNGDSYSDIIEVNPTMNFELTAKN